LLHIVVFARFAEEFIDWAKRHEALSNLRPRMQLVALVEENVEASSLSHASGVRPDLCISGKRMVERINALGSHVGRGDYILVCACDDDILKLQVPNDELGARWLGLHPTAYFGSNFRPAISNQIFKDLSHPSDPRDRLRRYFQCPFPGDNSIFYGLFVFEKWFETFHWAASQIGGIENCESFHAFDWLWMSRLIYLAPLHKPTDRLVIRRAENNWKKYHNIYDCKDTDFVLNNPLWPLIKTLHRAYPDVHLKNQLYSWLVVKVRERCKLTGEEAPNSESLKEQFLEGLKIH